jgi:parvulin-like peptidyl-prolyl isomerase
MLGGTRMKKLIIILAVAFVLFSITSCSKKPAAIVNGEEISREDFQRQLNQRIEAHKAQGVPVDEKALKEAVIQEMIGRRLLLQAARERNITVSDEELKETLEEMKNRFGEQKIQDSLRRWNLTEEQYRQRVKESLMIKKYINQLVPDDSITEEDMKKFYNESPKPFIKPERVQVRIIQVNTEEEAQKIYEEWKKSKIDFDEFADKLAKEKRAVVTQYGWVQPNFFTGPIRDALKELKEGEVGGPYRGKDGYYMLRIKKREPEKVMSYEEAKDQIKATLLMQRREATRAHLIAERKKKSEIKIYIK